MGILAWWITPENRDSHFIFGALLDLGKFEQSYNFPKGAWPRSFI